jgi:hypothetical protein
MADDPATTGAKTDAKGGGASRGFFRRLLGWLRGDG